MESQIELAERSIRFMKLLPVGKDKTLLVLKGHLIIEEVLTDLLKLKLEQSNPLNIKISSSTMFAQKLNLCWAIIQSDIDSNSCVFLKELNSIRNKITHSVEPNMIEEKIEKFIELVLNYGGYMMPKAMGNDLELSICYLFIMTSQYFHNAKNQQAIHNKQPSSLPK